MPIKLMTPPEQIKADAVSILREELQRAEAGQVLGVIVITKDTDGMWTHHATGTLSIREQIGAIEGLKWNILYHSRSPS